MKPEILACKEIEYSVRLAMAIYMGDNELIRKRALAYLVILRHCARAAHDLSERKYKEICDLDSIVDKAKKDGITCVLTKPRLKQLREEAKKARDALARVGGTICSTLDLWQEAGATFEDLCSLCNRNPEQVRAELRDEDLIKSFSKLATIENLDYKNPRETGFIEDYVDAPLTHALKAYLVWAMTETEEGRKRTHEAMERFFPEIMENAYTEVTDEDGVRHLYDKDGEEVGILGDEDDL